MAESKKSSPWVWVSLGLMIGLFVAFIVFLDQTIVNDSRDKKEVPNVKADKKLKEPVIDFYSVLPNRKVDIPDDTSQDHIDKPNKKTAKISKPEKFFLQAGSFNKRTDAERRKAELAFLGVEAAIHSAVVKGITYFRINIGPLSDSQSSRIQKQLIENDIAFLLKMAK